MRAVLLSIFLAALVSLSAITLVMPQLILAATSTPLTFLNNHQLYDRGADIRSLQEFLNAHGFIVALSGPGSPRNETSFFGLLTFRALKKFQAAQGLPATGFLGPLTRGKLGTFTNTSSANSPSSSSSSTPAPGVSTTTVPIQPLYVPSTGSMQGFGGSVGDIVPPTISSVSSLTTEATSGSGASVSYTNPAATDDVDGATSVSCTPASGSTFALGATTVTCSATDRAGNTSSSPFAVTVRDTTPPTISGTPSNLTVEATSGSGATVTYTNPTASDLVDGTDGISCSPASGSTFTLGATTVTCTVTDAHNNAAHTTFTVTVQDTTAPTVSLTAPSNGATVSGSSVTLSANSSDAVGVAGVQFKVDGANTGSEDTSSPYSITWDSTATSSGSKTIVAVARDAAGNYATSTAITVTVDNTAPVISSISSGTPSDIIATTTWTTDEGATSKVVYGLTSSYGNTTTLDSTLTTSHQVILTERWSRFSGQNGGLAKVDSGFDYAANFSSSACVA